ncbi:MAG: M23 family metallopeptidase [Myxococcaceae bacterium]|nr:M23 family metallopeptidase [Myxococcaceae bacterium]MCI0670051.1 M23 family metallopeptidase [Myxococcaceae bacterium]
MRRSAPLLLLLLAPPAVGQGVAGEQAEVKQRLSAQRTAAALLAAEQGSVLETLEFAERMARLSAARTRASERELKGLERRVAQAEALSKVAGAALQEQLRSLGPRLRLMDRRLRRRPLDVLLSSESFTALVWRARAMGTLLEQDLDALRRVERARTYQAQATAELAILRAGVASQVTALSAHRQREAEQREVLVDLLRFVQAEGRDSRRLIAELERAERGLARYVAALETGPETSGFGTLRGQLPMPAAGRVEVAFGKVVNPRFQTVTVHKGVDIRAPAGSPVRAVADGTVVHAGWLRGYGNLLILEHGGGYHTLMAHLDTLDKRVGEQVRSGEPLGSVGDTASLKGAYLYFEVRRRGEALDPADWLRPN